MWAHPGTETHEAESDSRSCHDDVHDSSKPRVTAFLIARMVLRNTASMFDISSPMRSHKTLKCSRDQQAFSSRVHTTLLHSKCVCVRVCVCVRARICACIRICVYVYMCGCGLGVGVAQGRFVCPVLVYLSFLE